MEANSQPQLGGLAPYDGFRDDEVSSIKIEKVTVFDEDQDVDFTPSCWSRFKFVIWGVIVVAVVGAIVGLSVTMVIVTDDGNKSGSEDVSRLGDGLSPSPGGGSSGTSASGGGTSKDGDSDGRSPAEEVFPMASDQDGTLEIMANPNFPVPPGWTALWWDNFDGNELNPRWWNYQYGFGEAEGLWAWGNEEEQFYTDRAENVMVSDGTLKITARKEDTELPDGYVFKYTSGRINSKGKAAFFGGMKTADGKLWNTIRIEASLKAPIPTTGLWAAYWMLPIDMRYGVWASSGEIDIYEMKNEFIKNNMALHYGGPWPKYSERYNEYEKRPGGGSFSNDFTVVTMDWSPTKITMSMQGEQMFELESSSISPTGWYSKTLNGGPNPPFDIPFYFVLNLAVGGKYPGDPSPDIIMPNTFEIDYIRVFGKN